MSERKTKMSGMTAGVWMPDEGERAKISSGFKHVIDINLGRRLSFLHEELGSDKFVQLTGRSTKQIRRYERGDNVPLRVLESISKATGVSYDWMTNGHILTTADEEFQKDLIRRQISIHEKVLSKDVPDVDRAISESAIEHWQFVLSELEGHMLQKQGAASSTSALDVERLELAIATVERGLDEADRVAAPDVKAGMISAAYEILTEPTEAAVGRILRLVKG